MTELWCDAHALELASERAGREVRVGLGGRHLADRAGHPHLAAEWLPVEREGRAWVVGQIAALGALVVREEREAAVVGALQQDHPIGGRPVGARGRQRHRGRLVHVLGGDRLGEPLLEQGDRLGCHVPRFAPTAAPRR